MLQTQVLKQLLLSVNIQSTGGFIQQEYTACSQQSSGNGYPLSLTFAQSCSEFTAEGIKSLWQLPYEVGTGSMQDIIHLGLSSIGIAEQQIIPDGSAKQRITLRDIHQIGASKR